jgi:hypothetical protein
MSGPAAIEPGQSAGTAHKQAAYASDKHSGLRPHDVPGVSRGRGVAP